MKVSKRCLVKFSIGKEYNDEVWGDMVPMDACHILLGRPWQFDRKTKHDGFKNTYTFQKDGATIILGPSRLRKEARNHFLSRTEFLTEVSGAVVPHRAAYRMNPKEHELQRQGRESLKKDSIQESMNIEKQNKKYKERADRRRQRVIFKEEDLVWIRLEKERFPTGRFGKLQSRSDGPFRVLKRINDNAYKIDLPGEYNVSATFNVADLSPYVTDGEGSEEEEIGDIQQDSRTNLFLAGEYGAEGF